jgi:hypothetical protein
MLRHIQWVVTETKIFLFLKRKNTKSEKGTSR